MIAFFMTGSFFDELLLIISVNENSLCLIMDITQNFLNLHKSSYKLLQELKNIKSKKDKKMHQTLPDCSCCRGFCWQCWFWLTAEEWLLVGFLLH